MFPSKVDSDFLYSPFKIHKWWILKVTVAGYFWGKTVIIMKSFGLLELNSHLNKDLAKKVSLCSSKIYLKMSVYEFARVSNVNT